MAKRQGHFFHYENTVITEEVEDFVEGEEEYLNYINPTSLKRTYDCYLNEK
jgi:hypothetical protein